MILNIKSIEIEVENKTVTQDIETSKPLTKKIPCEAIKAKYLSMEMSDTFYDNYIEYKHIRKCYFIGLSP